MFLPPGFDRAIAVEAAGLVNQAYDQYRQFAHGAAWYLQGDYDALGLLSARPAGSRVEPFGFVARNRTSGRVFVTFRGTESIEDWASNLAFPQVDHPWGRAARGFKDLYDQCAATAKAAVGQTAGAAVFVTGHSLGGALATLATADLVGSGVSAGASLYNFASPRVGDRSFASRFNTSVGTRWRIVNTEDIVTTVPMATPELASSSSPNSPLGMFLMLAHHLDYEHVGDAVTFTAHYGSIVANHQMSTYIAAL